MDLGLTSTVQWLYQIRLWGWVKFAILCWDTWGLCNFIMFLHSQDDSPGEGDLPFQLSSQSSSSHSQLTVDLPVHILQVQDVKVKTVYCEHSLVLPDENTLLSIGSWISLTRSSKQRAALHDLSCVCYQPLIHQRWLVFFLCYWAMNN